MFISVLCPSCAKAKSEGWCNYVLCMTAGVNMLCLMITLCLSIIVATIDSFQNNTITRRRMMQMTGLLYVPDVGLI